MSYDLTVYCPGSPTIEEVALLVGNTRGFHVDPANSNDTGVVVLRGVKRDYSFTVDGPFTVEVEDVPEEVAAVLSDAATMFQILVEGTQETEIPHGVRFAKKLAKACHGVAVDEQTDEVWPKPRVARTPSAAKEKRAVNSVWVSWLLPEDELPEDFLARYLQMAQELLPQAVPVRFGKYEPLQGRFDTAGAEGFITEYYNSEINDWSLYYKNPSPVTYGSISSHELQWGNPFTRIILAVDEPALADEAFRAAVRSFFLTVASELRATYAWAELDNRQDMTRVPLIYLPPTQWVGFQPYPVWWVWAGPRLVPDIGRFLGPDAIEHSGGLFRAYSDEPLDRHQLSVKLGPKNLPWIPANYSATYSDEYMAYQPLATAEVVPVPLRNREPLELPYAFRNPPRKA
ncbi:MULTISPECIES: hypothetical protein [Paenarthrobacter]|uniref:hypothetical protein n=1 Tax=Paenarthrobacter TaxID=1742992 RepID=UPI00074D385C|nr:hypothetical protein [Paenarthrobacter ureafaciens]AMB42036.1 hypothetical protein AUT26_18840 [Arthrobacter sp. ATCC 21022]KUR62714.1 hypothetical protein JM67_20110 [Arthrobacter sp. ATCC 21022]